MFAMWPKGEPKLERGQIWVDPLPAGTPGREPDGYAYYDPWKKRSAIFRDLVEISSERQAQGFAQTWGPLGEPQPENGVARPEGLHTGVVGRDLSPLSKAMERWEREGRVGRWPPAEASPPPGGSSDQLVRNVEPPGGRLTRWDPRWPQPAAAYLRQATALREVSGAVVALREDSPVDTRQLRDAIEGSGLVVGSLPREWSPDELVCEYFRWAGTESRSFLVTDDHGRLSLGHEYRSLVAPAVLGMLEGSLERLGPCHYPDCTVLTTRHHCGKSHERACPLKDEHKPAAGGRPTQPPESAQGLPARTEPAGPRPGATPLPDRLTRTAIDRS